MRSIVATKRVVLTVLLLTVGVRASADTITLYTPFAGDATYAWNSKYGSQGYGTGATTMGIYLYFGGTWGNDHTVSIFEVPITALAGQPLTEAMLQVDALDFGTSYSYGSAGIGWLDVGAKVVTGDVVADALGPTSTSLPSSFPIWDSGVPYTPGVKSFNVLSYVQADLAAGRAYSTFVMSGSRETWGSLYTAEDLGNHGPRIVATVPEPGSLTLLGMGAIGLLGWAWKRRKA